MRGQRHLSGRFVRPRGLRRGVAVALALLIVGLGGGYLYVTRPARAARLAGDLLTAMTGAQVSIREARFGLGGTIHLRGIALRLPDTADPAGELFEAEQVLLRHDPLSLLGGHFQARSLTFLRPTLYLTEDLDRGQFNFQALQALRRQGDGDTPLALPESLPEVYLRAGRIVFGEVQGGRYQSRGTFALSGNLTSLQPQDQGYAFKLEQDREDAGPPLLLTGHLDLQTVSVQAQLDHLRFEGSQRYLLPRWLREWWDALQPSGSFPTASVRYRPGRPDGLEATLALQDLSIRLPFGEWLPAEPDPAELAEAAEADSALPADPAQVVMQVERGTFHLSEQTVRVEGLEGRVEGFRYRLDAVGRGLNKDAPFTLTARITGVLPQRPHYLPYLPQRVAKHFARFQPSGAFDAEVTLDRRQPAGPVDYRGAIRIHEGAVCYYKFPYPLTAVEGELTFNDRELRIVSLAGQGPTGTRARIEGVIAPPGLGAAVDLTVAAEQALVDEVLISALKPKHRQMLEMVFRREAYERLAAEDGGVVLAPARQAALAEQRAALAAQAARDPAAGAALAEVEALLRRPTFELGGRVNMIAHVRRPFGPAEQYTTELDIEPAGARVLLKWWPYPMTVTGGRLKIEPARVTLEGITAAGSGGGQARVEGELLIAADAAEGGAATLVPRVDFTFADVPVDELLLAALPRRAGRWLGRLDLQGRLGGQGRVFLSEAGAVEFEVAAAIKGATARPFTGGYALADLEADIQVRRDHVRIRQATARHGDSTLALTGALTTAGADPRLQLEITGRDLNLADPLLDLVPPDLADLAPLHQLLETYQPQGTLDAALTYQHPLEDKAPPEPGNTLNLRSAGGGGPAPSPPFRGWGERAGVRGLFPPLPRFGGGEGWGGGAETVGKHHARVQQTPLTQPLPPKAGGEGPEMPIAQPNALSGSRPSVTSDGLPETGAASAIVADRTTTVGSAPHYNLVLQPHNLAFTFNGERLTFRDLQGRISTGSDDPRRVEIDRFRAAFDQHGRVELSGFLVMDEPMTADLVLSGANDHLGPTAWAFLPHPVRRAVEGMALAGGWRLETARLRRFADPQSAHLPQGFDFGGTLRLEQAKADLGLALTEMTAALDIAARSQSDSPFPRLEVNLQAPALRAAERPVQDLSLTLSNAADPAVLALTGLNARSNGGRLTGEGAVRLDRPGQYRLRLTLDQAALTPTLFPPPLPPPEAGARAGAGHPSGAGSLSGAGVPPANPRPHLSGPGVPSGAGVPPASLPPSQQGVISADLSLEGTAGDPASRSGRGRLAVRDARLQQLPVAVALLHLLNLNLPASEAFDRADATFLIQGDQIHLEHVRMDSPSLSIEGAGTMTYSTRALDLMLAVRNPAGPDLGPLSELIQLFKDEFISIHVAGTLDQPQPRLKSLKGFSNSLEEFFGK